VAALVPDAHAVRVHLLEAVNQREPRLTARGLEAPDGMASIAAPGALVAHNDVGFGSAAATPLQKAETADFRAKYRAVGSQRFAGIWQGVGTGQCQFPITALRISRGASCWDVLPGTAGGAPAGRGRRADALGGACVEPVQVEAGS
jgi:hypothetical protein